MNQHSSALRGLEIALPPGHDLPPQNIAQIYARKPLPPPPPPKSPARRVAAAQSSTDPLRRGSSPRAHTDRINALPPLIPPIVTSIPTSSSRRTSIASPTPTGHRSSRKVQQLTGCDVDINDVKPQRKSLRQSGWSFDEASDCSPSFHATWSTSDGFDNLLLSSNPTDTTAPPSLDFDIEGVSSRCSSWTPASPRAVAIAPLNIEKPVICPSTAMSFKEPRSVHQVSFDESVLMLEKEPDYAGEDDLRLSRDDDGLDAYHRMAADLATPTVRTSVDDLALLKVSGLSQRIYQPSRRPPPLPILAASPLIIKEGAAQQRTITRRPLPHSAHDGTLAEGHSKPSSFFDENSDSDEEDAGHGPSSVTRRWQAIRSQARRVESPDFRRLWTRAEGQMRDLATKAKDGTKAMHTSEEEKRRKQLKQKITVLLLPKLPISIECPASTPLLPGQGLFRGRRNNQSNPPMNLWVFRPPR